MSPADTDADGRRRKDRCAACGAASDWGASACEACHAPFDPDEPVPVFETADAQLLPLLRSALEAADIPCAIQGEGALGLFPLGPFAGGLTRNLVAATIRVPRRDATAALDVLGGIPLAEQDADPDADEGSEP